MKARYAGWCRVCKERIGRGEEIAPASGQEGWAHFQCPATLGLPAARSPRIHPARTGVTGGKRAGHTRGIRKIA